jgi:acetyl esterase/lipase
VQTADRDPIRDDGIRYAAALRDAGVATRRHELPQDAAWLRLHAGPAPPWGASSGGSWPAELAAALGAGDRG